MSLGPRIRTDHGHYLDQIRDNDGQPFEPGGDVAASDVAVSPAVAGESDVQGALEALAETVVVSGTDPGAIGAGRIWLRVGEIGEGETYYSVYVRNATDDGWLATSSALYDSEGKLRGTTVNNDGAGDSFEIRAFDAAGVLRNDISIFDEGLQILHYGPDGLDGEATASVVLGNDGDSAARMSVFEDTGQASIEMGGSLGAGYVLLRSRDSEGVEVANVSVSAFGVEILGDVNAYGRVFGTFVLPGQDPEIAGAIWNDNGTPTISAGPTP